MGAPAEIQNRQINEELFNSARPKISERLRDPTLSKFLPAAQRHAINPPPETYEAFQKIPRCTKSTLFGPESPLLDLVNIDQPRQFIPAAGTSRTLLAYRFRDRNAEQSQFEKLAGAAAGLLGINVKQTLFINAYPTGITIPDNFHSIDCGAKPEVVNLALTDLLRRYPSAVLTAQPHMLRYLAVHGFIPKEALPKLYFAIGGTWVPPTYFQTLTLAGHTEADWMSRTLCMYGIAEVGLGIGIAVPAMHKMRGASLAQPFAVSTDRYYVETVDGQVAVTTLAADCATPLLRYDTRDSGALFKSSPETGGQTLLAVALGSPQGVASMKVDTWMHGNPGQWQYLTGNYHIDGDRITLETYPDKALPSELEHGLEQQVPGAELRFTSRLVPRHPIWTDLLRKPKPYT